MVELDERERENLIDTIVTQAPVDTNLDKRFATNALAKQDDATIRGLHADVERVQMQAAHLDNSQSLQGVALADCRLEHGRDRHRLIKQLRRIAAKPTHG